MKHFNLLAIGILSLLLVGCSYNANEATSAVSSQMASDDIVTPSTAEHMVLFCDTRRIRQKLPRRIMNRGITDMLAQNLLQRFMRVAFAWKNISV